MINVCSVRGGGGRASAGQATRQADSPVSRTRRSALHRPRRGRGAALTIFSTKQARIWNSVWQKEKKSQGTKFFLPQATVFHLCRDRDWFQEGGKAALDAGVWKQL